MLIGFGLIYGLIKKENPVVALRKSVARYSIAARKSFVKHSIAIRKSITRSSMLVNKPRLSMNYMKSSMILNLRFVTLIKLFIKIILITSLSAIQASNMLEIMTTTIIMMKVFHK